MNINKTLLALRLAKTTGLSEQQAEVAVDGVFASIADALKNDDVVRILGFGTFSMQTRAARTAQNPRTRATINIASKRVPKFKVSTTLSRALQED